MQSINHQLTLKCTGNRIKEDCIPVNTELRTPSAIYTHTAAYSLYTVYNHTQDLYLLTFMNITKH